MIISASSASPFMFQRIFINCILQVSDLGNLIGLYSEWHSHLLPYYSFDQFVHKVEKVGTTKRVKVYDIHFCNDSTFLIFQHDEETLLNPLVNLSSDLTLNYQFNLKV